MGVNVAIVPPALARRVITEESHQQFATLSGDLNPLHVDREAAKSMPPGQRLAYGMDMLLWALDSLETQHSLPERLARVRVRFTKWVFLEDEIELHPSSGAKADSYDLTVRDTTVASFDLLAGDLQSAELPECSHAPAERRQNPNGLLLHELQGHSGAVAVASRTHAAEMFPALADRFGTQWLGECATCSYIIGMEAPGLYSMSMKYDLEFYASPRESACMHFKVMAADERFRKIRIAVQGAAIAATLEAMVREP